MVHPRIIVSAGTSYVYTFDSDSVLTFIKFDARGNVSVGRNQPAAAGPLIRSISIFLIGLSCVGRVVAQDASDICPIEYVEGAHWVGATEASGPNLRVAPTWQAPSAWRPTARQSAFATAVANVYLTSPEEGAPVEVELQRLYGDGSRLDGQYARVRSSVIHPGVTSAPGINGTPDYRFEAILDPLEDCNLNHALCSEFDAPNVYYHLDRYAKEFWTDRLGVEIAFQADVSVHIAGLGGFTIPPDNVLKLAVGHLFMKNAALSDDVMYHEYTHLVAYQLGWTITTDTPVEVRALGEGYADYFSASYTDDPRFGEWVVTCPDRAHCEGPANDLEFRRLDLDPAEWNWNDGQPDPALRYGFCLRYHTGDTKCKASHNNFTDTYVWGMIWGGLLWDLRVALGADVVDYLAVESMQHHDDASTFETAARDLLNADAFLNGGRYQATIEALLERRGIFAADAVGVERAGIPGDAGPLSVYPNPVSDVLTIDSEDRVELVDVLGRVRLVATAGDRRLDVSGLAPGLYVVRSGTVTQPVFIIR